jgi:hypothetical protein
MTMTRMMKVGALSLGLALLAGISLPSQAHAGNESWPNGTSLNGGGTNGVALNGHSTQGESPNGHSTQGGGTNGITGNGQDASTADLGGLALRSVQLPDGRRLTVARP